ncbi:hypothetical protein FHS15_005768 [Paenibacillus castaneae]|uniref:DUF1871 family protein n=1 Tax=Paenibacillus castaneae TaxID=474957 RepID=UPI000C9B54FC|nr:DUF1871 family protein [Paenibacillus castaneae]NIK80577.1 hypothetical protein [Paenibacillus castaneae]
MKKSMSIEERLNLAKVQIAEEKRYLSNLLIDTAPIFQIVKMFVDQWDPFGLLAMDCPPDEYESEIRRITIYITKHLNDLDAFELEKHIRSIFEDNFEEEVAQDQRSVDVADAIFTALKEGNLVFLC